MTENTYILGIDPGNSESAYCLCSPELKPIEFGKLPNDAFTLKVVDLIKKSIWNSEVRNYVVVIEDVESFGMPVGKTVFDTAKYIGYLKAKFEDYRTNVRYIYRHEEKMTICHSAKANDATIKQALVDRFAPGVPNHGKGSKKEPEFFYGFKADCWSAFAICVAYHDMYLCNSEETDNLHIDELPF